MSTAAPSTACAVRRWAVIVAAGLSGVLVLVSMLVDPAPSADYRELIAAYAGDQFASGLHTNLIHYGFALIAPVVYAMVAMVRHRGAWLANVAGMLAVIGLSTLPGLVIIDLVTTATVNATDVDTAYAAAQALDELPAFLAIVAFAFPAAVFALPVAIIAMWRAGLFPWYAALLAVPMAVAPQFLPWSAGFGVAMVWMLLVAYWLWRVPSSAWFGGDRAVADAGAQGTPAPAATGQELAVERG